MALCTRSRHSMTLVSGRPTSTIAGSPPSLTSTSTWTGSASTPKRAAVLRSANIARHVASRRPLTDVRCRGGVSRPSQFLRTWTRRRVEDCAGASETDEERLRAFQDQRAVLVVHGGAERHDTGGALALQLGDCQLRIERVAQIDRGEKARGLLQKAHEPFAQHVGKQPGAGSGGGQHLKAMGDRCPMPVGTAVLDVVVHRVIIGRHGLKGSELSVGHRSARDRKSVADLKLVKGPGGNQSMRGGVELGHVGGPG